MSHLTDKQEAFALKFVECEDATEAYRACYDASNMKPGSIWVAAHEARHNPKVSLRIDELLAKKRAIGEDKLTITLEQRMEWLKTVAEAGISTYEEMRGDGRVVEKYHGLSATNQAVANLNAMLGTEPDSGDKKPVKVSFGVQDASKS